MTIDIAEIKRLRELTGVGMTDAKRALEAAEGDFDKALAEMRKKGLTKAEKSAAREARAGLISSYVHDGRIGVLLKVNCETDFVARNEKFTDFVKNIAMHIAATAPLYVTSDQVPEAERERAAVEFTEKVKAEGKPEAAMTKIVEGRVTGFYKGEVLLDQAFAKDAKKSVAQVLEEAGVKGTAFARFRVGSKSETSQTPVRQ